jgi:hypothetical protein
MAKNPSLPRFASALVLIALGHAAEFPRQTAGHYQITLRLPAEGLYAQEESQIEFRIEDLARPDPLTGFTPVVRATPQAVIDMPAMRAMPQFTELAHAEPAPGDYGIHPTFAHGGDYRLRITIEPKVTAEFPIAVSDAQAKRKAVPPRYTLELTANPKKPKPGEPVELRLLVRDRDNKYAPVTAFETVHEKLLHLVIVRRDLALFAHEHPSPNPDGSFTLCHTFTTPGEYHLFADTAPQGAGGQILFAKLTVPGKVVETDDHTITHFGAYPARKTIPIAFPPRPTPLEPWLGAIGHLLLIHEDGQTFVHSHPDDSGTLTFLTRFPKPGEYRAWLQYQTGGKLHTETFGVHAK